MVVADLGMTAAQRRQLSSRFPRATVMPFDFSPYPAHVRALHSCAWKPAVIEQVLAERGGLVLWLDAGSIVHRSLNEAFATTARDGILSLAGRSAARRWCHPATFAAMNVCEDDRDQRCRAGGVLGFDASRQDVHRLVADWCRWAFDRDCIEPAGAARANHRYDQAILTNLLNAAARQGRFVLQDGEIDISSPDPVRWVSTRNSVPSWMPIAIDPLVRGWYAVVKTIDRAVLRAKERSRAGSYPPASVRTARR